VDGIDPVYALLRPGSKLAYELQTLQDWTVIHRSEELILLEPPAS
jgi:hypothetical protein